jgi:hypothetical protein
MRQHVKSNAERADRAEPSHEFQASPGLKSETVRAGAVAVQDWRGQGLSRSFAGIPVTGQSAPTLQRKLMASQSTDPLEREANRAANLILLMPEPGNAVRRGGSACGSESGAEEDSLCPECVKSLETGATFHAKSETGAVPADHAQSSVQRIIAGAGRPLDSQTRSYFEPRFARDFSGVRIHTGDQAAHSADDVAARAYTVGNHIVFGKNQFSPASTEGRRLIAHELTHVVQQGRASKLNEPASASTDLANSRVQPMIQRDLAIEPPSPGAVGRVLTPDEMAEAIAFNTRVLGAIDNSADIIQMIRDVIGVSPSPAIVDEDFVNGVVQWQANFGVTQDGKLGPTSARPLFREIGAEGVGRGEVSRAPRYTPAGPINVPAAAPRDAHFDMSAEFRSDAANGVFPSCCEVRQDIQWDAAFVAASVAAGNGAVPHAGFPAAHPADTWIEDRNATNSLRYGHRAFFDRGPGNRYLDTTGAQNQAYGHIFEGQDNPSGLVGDQGSWSFRLRVVDVCNGNRTLARSPTLVLNWL